MPILKSGSPLSYEIRTVYKNRKLRVAANAAFIRVKLEGQLELHSVCSINKPNEVQPMQKSNLTVSSDSRWPIFIPSNTEPSEELPSVVTLKPANDGHLKTGQRTFGEDVLRETVHWKCGTHSYAATIALQFC